jgi:hypothetical protein
MSIHKTDRPSPYIVRWREGGRHHSRSFRTRREAREFQAALEVAKRRNRTMTDLEREARAALGEEDR